MEDNRIKEAIKGIAWEAWNFAANAYRMYPDSKHTFAEYWNDDKAELFLASLQSPLLNNSEGVKPDLELLSNCLSAILAYPHNDKEVILNEVKKIKKTVDIMQEEYKTQSSAPLKEGDIKWNDELVVAFAEIYRFSSSRTNLKQFKEMIGTDWEVTLRKTAKEILTEWESVSAPLDKEREEKDEVLPMPTKEEFTFNGKFEKVHYDIAMKAWNKYENKVEQEVEDKSQIEMYKEECERLEKIVKFWQEKYYEINPPVQNPKIDNF